jgi:hypothetical protein
MRAERHAPARRHRCGIFAAAVLALSPLAGCGWVHSPFASAPQEACPSAIVLRPLANTAVFAPGQPPTPESVAFYGILSEIDAHCEYTSGAVREQLDVVLVGQRGPAAGKADTVALDYFVAVLGPNERILNKRPFAVHIVFPPTGPRAGVTDHIEETIPLAGFRGSQLQIVAGFQQSPETVEFYRHFRGR